MNTPKNFLRVALSMLLAFIVAGTLASPAFADGGTGGSGPGSGGGGGGGSSGQAGARYVCATNGSGEGWTRYADGRTEGRFTTGFPRCYNPAAVDLNQDQICNVGFEVWRFYSRNTDVVSATRSYAWLDKRCTGDYVQSTGIFYYPHPDDAGYVRKGTLPWRENEWKNAWGLPVAMATTGGPNLTTTSGVEKPFGQSCRVLQPAVDPVAPYFNGNKRAQGADFRNRVYNDIYTHWIGSLGTYGALSVINARDPLPVNGDTINYDDGLACSSNVDFSYTDRNQPIYFGSCWIPLNMRAALFRNSVNGATERAYYVDQVGRRLLGGVKYSNQYSFRSGGSDGPLGAYREYMYQAAKAQGPGQPYVNAAATPAAVNREAAAATLRDFAHCGYGTGLSVDGNEQAFETTTSASVDIVVNTPDVLQATGYKSGAYGTPAERMAPKVTVRAENYRCGALLCSEEAANTSNSSGISVQRVLQLGGMQYGVAAPANDTAESFGVSKQSSTDLTPVSGSDVALTYNIKQEGTFNGTSSYASTLFTSMINSYRATTPGNNARNDVRVLLTGNGTNNAITATEKVPQINIFTMTFCPNGNGNGTAGTKVDCYPVTTRSVSYNTANVTVNVYREYTDESGIVRKVRVDNSGVGALLKAVSATDTPRDTIS